jgi:hypothetical protein
MRASYDDRSLIQTDYRIVSPSLAISVFPCRTTTNDFFRQNVNCLQPDCGKERVDVPKSIVQAS